MEDIELLEWAAKAAGYIEVWQPDGWTDDGPWRWHETMQWNPLQDDGDALRLAVKLRLSIDHNHPADQQHWVVADRNGCEGCYAPVSCVEDDFDDESQRSSATRRAIVRAAAEIGKAQN